MSAKKQGSNNPEVPWYQEATYLMAKDAAKAALSTFEARGSIYDTALKQEQAALTQTDKARIDVYKLVKDEADKAGHSTGAAGAIASLFIADEWDKARIALELAKRYPEVLVDQQLHEWKQWTDTTEQGWLDQLLDYIGGIGASLPMPWELLTVGLGTALAGFAASFSTIMTGFASQMWDKLAEALKPTEEEGD